MATPILTGKTDNATTASTAVYAGAAAFLDLIRRIQEKGDKDLEFHEDSEGDVRDYFEMAEMVQASIRENLEHAAQAHRQGYLRALTDLISIVGDDCGPGDEWDPISGTERAFLARGAA
jgi:hypothetical protein